MEYRRLGKSNLNVSVIGFGGMRIPEVSEEEAYKVINKAIDLKINFFETAPGYGDSEAKIGKSLGKRRKDIYLSTKSNYGYAKTSDELQAFVETQLKRLNTDYLDFYQMWFVQSREEFEKIIAKGGNYEGAIKLKKQGIIKHIGITSHAEPSDIEYFIRTGLFESVTIYYNAFAHKYAGIPKIARELDMGVVCMGPLNGGLLGSDSGKFRFLRRGKATTNVLGALRYIIGNPDISTAIVGFRKPEEVEEDLLAGDFYEDIKNTNDVAEIMQEFEKLKENVPKTVCSMCNYCAPCTNKINIPGIFELVTQANFYGTVDLARERYDKRIKVKADACTDCKKCVEKCPQKINIPEDLKKAHKFLS